MGESDQQNQNGDSLTVYRRLVRDERISHGAFRLWHYLRDRANAESICWPQQRTIASELHCKPHSLAGWIRELTTNGYLQVEMKGANHHYVYRILDGLVMPKPASRGDAPIGNTNPAVMPKAASPVLPISASGDAQSGIARDAQMGNVSNNNEVITLSKGEQSSCPITTPQFEPVEKGLFRKEYDAMLAYAKRQRDQIKNSQWSRTHPEQCRIAFEAWDTRVGDIRKAMEGIKG